MPESTNFDKSAAVIGSGFGGLAAAIRLQSAGVNTVLYEARDKPGGRAYVYHDDGYTFDAGPTVVTAPHTLEELCELSDRKLEDYIELMEVSPMYRLFGVMVTVLIMSAMRIKCLNKSASEVKKTQ